MAENLELVERHMTEQQVKDLLPDLADLRLPGDRPVSEGWFQHLSIGFIKVTAREMRVLHEVSMATNPTEGLKPLNIKCTSTASPMDYTVFF